MGTYMFKASPASMPPTCLPILAARVEGYRGFYRGWVANTIKVVPQNAIRMVSYEMLKKLLGIQKAKTDT